MVGWLKGKYDFAKVLIGILYIFDCKYKEEFETSPRI